VFAPVISSEQLNRSSDARTPKIRTLSPADAETKALTDEFLKSAATGCESDMTCDLRELKEIVKEKNLFPD
jgi:hypothetical protein